MGAMATIKWLVTELLGMPPAPEARRPPQIWEPDRRANDGLITVAHLERHLPAELPFRGHTLKRGQIWSWRSREQYMVSYKCDPFFNCNHPPSGAFEVFDARLDERSDGSHVMILSPRRPKNSLVGGMTFDRVPPEQLSEALREQLRAMYRHLEEEVEEEALRGCSIRPPTL